MVWYGQRLRPAMRFPAQFYMASPLRKNRESEFRQYPDDIFTG